MRDGFNWYVYCAGNPVKFVDPSGLKVNNSIDVICLYNLIYAKCKKAYNNCITELQIGNENGISIEKNSNFQEALKKECNIWKNIIVTDENDVDICYYDVPVFTQKNNTNICWILSEISIYAYYNEPCMTNEEALEMINDLGIDINEKNFANRGSNVYVSCFEELTNNLIEKGPLYGETKEHTFVIMGTISNSNNDQYVIYNYLSDGVRIETYTQFKEKNVTYYEYNSNNSWDKNKGEV